MKSRLTRRVVLRGLGAAGVVSAAGVGFGAPAGQVELRVNTGETLATPPANYTGLSYESAQLVHPDFFTAGNRDLVGLTRTLGPRGGVLRIGGNTSAFTAWQARGDGAQAKDAAAYGPDLGTGVKKQTPGMYPLTPRAIQNLRGFLDATGWGLIYGLNLRYGGPSSAAEEAAYVAQTCGAKLLALQFGNEPDEFYHTSGDEKPGTRWSYEEFLGACKAMYRAVHARVPHVPIAGPDCAFNASWVKRFAADTKGEVALLTTHYYAEGPPRDPRMTIDYLLHPGEKIQTDLYDAIDAAKAAHLPFRMSEGNSCYNGGKPGVSNTLASALWAGDFMLDLAARGAEGVNLHGGGEGVYTPIATDGAGRSTARPDFYGMWLAGQFAGVRMSRVTLGGISAGGNVTAYAGGQLVAIFNKGNADLQAAVRGLGTGKAEAFRLAGPSLASTSGVRFGTGAQEPGHQWTPGSDALVSLGAVPVAAGSAVLLRAH